MLTSVDNLGSLENTTPVKCQTGFLISIMLHRFLFQGVAAGLLKELVISGPDGFQRRLLRPFAATISLLFFSRSRFLLLQLKRGALWPMPAHKVRKKVCRPDGNVHHFFQLQLHLTALYIFVWIITLYDKLFKKIKV